jgi:hypothetical protein
VHADATLNARGNLARVVMPHHDGFIPDRRPERIPAPAIMPRRSLALVPAVNWLADGARWPLRGCLPRKCPDAEQPTGRSFAETVLCRDDA